jgi:hypothetical protein
VASYDVPPGDGGIQALFEGSPDHGVHTSAAAELAFLLGLVALVAAPFSVMHVLSLGAGALGLLFAVAGTATSSRPYVAGGTLAGFGAVFCCVALFIVGLRYVGLDTAFGDGLVPAIRDWLDQVNSWFPGP